MTFTGVEGKRLPKVEWRTCFAEDFEWKFVELSALILRFQRLQQP